MLREEGVRGAALAGSTTDDAVMVMDDEASACSDEIDEREPVLMKTRILTTDPRLKLHALAMLALWGAHEGSN